MMRARARVHVCGPRYLIAASPPSPPPRSLSAALPLPAHSAGPRRMAGCCRASLRVGAAGGTHGGAAGQPQGLFFTAAAPPSLSPCCAQALRTFPSPPTRPPRCVGRSRCVHVSLSRSPRCAHVRARTAPGSARVWSARGCPGALGAWCTALEASAPQSLRSKPPHQASASRPPGLTSGPPASSPGLQARCTPRVWWRHSQHCIATPYSWLDRLPLFVLSSRLTGLGGSSFAPPFAPPFLGGGFAAAISMRTISCSQMCRCGAHAVRMRCACGAHAVHAVHMQCTGDSPDRSYSSCSFVR